MVGSTVTIDSAGAWSELNPFAVINTSFMLQYALYVILGGTFYFSEVGFPSSLKKHSVSLRIVLINLCFLQL